MSFSIKHFFLFLIIISLSCEKKNVSTEENPTEINSDKELINEKRMVLIYGYEPPLQTGFSTTRSISFPMVDIKNPNVYEFYISKMKFIGESRVFTWHPKTGFIRID